MKATIDIPDELYRRVKARSAEEGRRIREVAIALFRQWLNKEIPVPEGATPGPVPMVQPEDLRQFPDLESMQKAYPRGYRLSGCLLPTSAGAPALRASVVDAELSAMDQEELNSDARPR